LEGLITPIKFQYRATTQEQLNRNGKMQRNGRPVEMSNWDGKSRISNDTYRKNFDSIFKNDNKKKEETMSEVELLKKQIQEEVKEKYTLYKRIKELNEEIEELKKEKHDG
jgi:peptidoglycan hydrolase CwlO-like protein